MPSAPLPPVGIVVEFDGDQVVGGGKSRWKVAEVDWLGLAWVMRKSAIDDGRG